MNPCPAPGTGGGGTARSLVLGDKDIPVPPPRAFPTPARSRDGIPAPRSRFFHGFPPTLAASCPRIRGRLLSRSSRSAGIHLRGHAGRGLGDTGTKGGWPSGRGCHPCCGKHLLGGSCFSVRFFRALSAVGKRDQVPGTPRTPGQPWGGSLCHLCPLTWSSSGWPCTAPPPAASAGAPPGSSFLVGWGWDGWTRWLWMDF